MKTAASVTFCPRWGFVSGGPIAAKSREGWCTEIWGASTGVGNEELWYLLVILAFLFLFST